jgi:hypothetical protein
MVVVPPGALQTSSETRAGGKFDATGPAFSRRPSGEVAVAVERPPEVAV